MKLLAYGVREREPNWPSSGGSTQFINDSSRKEEKLTKKQLEEIDAIINDGALSGDEKEEVALMTVCDLGGQEPFLAAHVALMPPGALSVYMLVFNGAKLLTDEAKSTYRKLEGDKINPIEQKLCRMETNGDFVKHWASAVHIAHPAKEQGDAFLGATEEVKFPAIFCVATHRWEAEKAAAQCAKGQTCVVDSIKENNEYLENVFQMNACQGHFVRSSKDDSKSSASSKLAFSSLRTRRPAQAQIRKIPLPRKLEVELTQ